MNQTIISQEELEYLVNNTKDLNELKQEMVWLEESVSNAQLQESKLATENIKLKESLENYKSYYEKMWIWGVSLNLIFLICLFIVI